MRRARLVAATAAMLTALLLQATVIGPATDPWPVSLPAVLVAAVGLVEGPATGMSLGFATGLLADLGSQHPAGVLALCWLGVGLACGLLADRHRLRRDALTVGVVCGLAAVAAAALLALVRTATSVSGALLYLIPTVAVDAVLAAAVLAVARRMLRTEWLRAPRPVYRELTVGGSRG